MPPRQNDVYAIMALADRYPADSLIPRITLLPFDAWVAFGRHVRRGEKAAIAVTTWIPVTERDDETGQRVAVTRTSRSGETHAALRPKDAYLFHIAQTEPFTFESPEFWTLTAEMQNALALCRDLDAPPAQEIAPAAPAPVTDSEPDDDEQLTRDATVTAGFDRFGNGRRAPGTAPLFSTLTR